LFLNSHAHSLDLRANASYFKAFINVAPVRRAPRRRAAASSNQDFETFTENEIDKAFEERMQRMEKSGVFGDNMEIQAFAREFNVNVKIFRKDYAYVISADNTSGNAVQSSEGRGFVYVAYHVSLAAESCFLVGDLYASNDG
jgi:OTU domain-containing protein 3